MQPERLFRALSDATRLQCLLLLIAEERLCVCEFVHALGLSQPRVSRHLAQLRDLGIVQDERRGQWVHYRLHPALPAWVVEVLEAVFRSEDVAAFRQRLAVMPGRPMIPPDQGRRA